MVIFFLCYNIAMDKKVIILFGPPGAGKGTQSELLSERMGMYLLEPSKVLERQFKRAENLQEGDPERTVNIDGQMFDALDEKEIWRRGELNSPPWVTHLIVGELRRLHNEGKSIILAGSPRTIYEAEHEMPVLRELYGKENIKIAMIEISAELTVLRNTNRKICELMRHSILHNKETEKLKLCPIDGSKLVRRKDLDDIKTITTRLEQYKERTLPLFEYFKNAGYEVKKINGEKSVAEVHEDIVKAIQ